ncbi:hypothetical protein C8Q74DRAFT_1030905 [Fomes fomentarius]|nr:hypothetical protein C8Q74DRAFT_1030905 [Fomes fomentarius]
MYYCLLDLPFDVLSIILDNISQHDALHLAVTCHRAYDVAIPRILATVILRDSNSAYASRHLITATPLSIPAAQKLSGFAKTVLSDPDHYGPLVQSLEIHASAFNAPVRPGRLFAKPDYSNIPLLAVAIRHTGNLRYISIGDVEVLVQREPTIGEIFKGFERLEEVKFANIGPVSASLLADMRSRPWSVEIDGVLDHFDDVCHALRTHADSLRRLTLRECLCFATGATAAPTVWPHVHTLTLGGLAPPLTTVAEAFPLVRLAQLAHVTSVKESPHPYPGRTWTL